ncbi:MAG: hypothetical protein IPJ98_31150 [Bryobacterales bacterium]|nr:hypothetical protein [Bryobacterales bacterium]
MNDGETVEIARLLQSRGEHLLVSRQSWGASWANLEPELQQQIRHFQAAHPGAPIYGIELAGPNPFGATDIDHHRYADADRSHTLSSLEQVAAILKVKLDRWRTLVAVNDRGYIPALEAFGASPEEIAAVRLADRRAQGLTESDEQRARDDLRAARWQGRKVFVPCADRITSAHSDLLHGQAGEMLLASPEELVYYGGRRRALEQMRFPGNYWSGGAPGGGYFGWERPSAELRNWVIDWFFATTGESPPPPPA